MFWALNTPFYKIGFTCRNIEQRLAEIQAYCPLELVPVGASIASSSQEKALQERLRKFRIHGEWFSFPEEIVWWIYKQLGYVIPEGVSVAESTN